MRTFERRLRKLEGRLTDTSGMAPHTPAWLEYWDRKMFEYMRDPEQRRPKELVPLDAFEAVLQWAGNPGSLVGTISLDEDQM